MGRWSASHWKTAVFGWLAFVVAAIAIGNAVGTKNISMQDANVGQSRKADQILSKGFPQADPQTELVCSCRARRAPSTIPRSGRRSTTSPPPSRETRRSRTSNRLDPKNRDQVSNNRRTVIVTWNMKGKADVAKKKTDGIEASVAKVGDRHPGFNVGETGSVSSGKALDKMFADQLKPAGERSIPITIVVLLPVFGALVAVGVPLLLALSGVIATTGVDPYRLHRPAVHPAPVGGRPFCSHCCA